MTMLIHACQWKACDSSKGISRIAFDLDHFGDRDAWRIDAVQTGCDEHVIFLNIGTDRHVAQRQLAGVARAGAFETLAEALMQDHYDPAYQRARREDTRRRLGVVEVEDLGVVDQEAAVARILSLVTDDPTLAV